MTTSKKSPKIWAAVALSAALSGCTTTELKQLSNPAPIHQDRPDEPTAVNEEVAAKSHQAYLDRAMSYYEAMETARSAKAPGAAIDAYVRAGITLVDVSCRHWFNNVSEAQRNIELRQENTNILYQLGTALIGIGRLHPDATALYGALTTGYVGYTKNLTSAYLVAPNAENIKQLTFDALRLRAGQLTGSAKPTTFDDAFNGLDSYADICTYAEVKRLANGAISGSQTADDNGKIIVVPRASDGRKAQANELFDPVKALLARVEKLGFSNALALANTMPFQTDPRIASSIKAMDPKNKRRSDSKVAKNVVRMALVSTTTTAAEVKQWQAAVKKVE